MEVNSPRASELCPECRDRVSAETKRRNRIVRNMKRAPGDEWAWVPGMAAHIRSLGEHIQKIVDTYHPDDPRGGYEYVGAVLNGAVSGMPTETIALVRSIVWFYECGLAHDQMLEDSAAVRADQGWRQAFKICGQRVRHAIEKLASTAASPGSPGADTDFAIAMLSLRELVWRAEEICGPIPPDVINLGAAKEELS